MTNETILTDEQVICPKCAHQFRAIPVQVQDLLLSVGYKPPFTQSALGATASDKLIEITTKAVLFEDCGNTEDWKDNTNLGQAAVNAVLQSPEIQALRKDAEIINWYFSGIDKSHWLGEYRRGFIEGWSVDQWRASMIAAMEQQK